LDFQNNDLGCITELAILLIEFRTTDIKDSEFIQPLWVPLNEYHYTKGEGLLTPKTKLY
jgi:hypothetical protein